LGFYLDAPSRMSYKGNYRPQQRLINGQWVEFDAE
jgi:arginyl-tRNA--protein-N-Asp/Glu arginylyltransferase